MTLNEIKERFENYFQENDWKVRIEERDDKVIINSGVTVKGKCKRCDVRYILSEGDITSVAYMPFGVDEDDENTLMELMKLVTRLNNSMIKFSRIELDLDEGTIRIAYDIDIEGQESISDSVLDYFVVGPSCVLDDFGNDLLDVALGYVSADDAWNAISER